MKEAAGASIVQGMHQHLIFPTDRDYLDSPYADDCLGFAQTVSKLFLYETGKVTKILRLSSPSEALTPTVIPNIKWHSHFVCYNNVDDEVLDPFFGKVLCLEEYTQAMFNLPLSEIKAVIQDP